MSLTCTHQGHIALTASSTIRSNAFLSPPMVDRSASSHVYFKALGKPRSTTPRWWRRGIWSTATLLVRIDIRETNSYLPGTVVHSGRPHRPRTRASTEVPMLMSSLAEAYFCEQQGSYMNNCSFRTPLAHPQSTRHDAVQTVLRHHRRIYVRPWRDHDGKLFPCRMPYLQCLSPTVIRRPDP